MSTNVTVGSLDIHQFIVPAGVTTQFTAVTVLSCFALIVYMITTVRRTMAGNRHKMPLLGGETVL